ncbi:MAG: hypothetical protein KAY82_03215 [Hylemonella sp.]|nr:hypothetical protein [Hylemonella sp.]
MSWFERLFSKPLFKSPKASSSSSTLRRSAEGRSNSPDDVAKRKAQRALHREYLHDVVRECMAAVGVLSSHYKFKVLTVDRESTQFVVMIDMLNLVAPDREGLSNMEASVAHRAMSLRGMRVIAVYWRMTDQASLLRPRAEARIPRPSSAPPSPVRRPDKPIYQELGLTDFPETDPRALGGTQYGEVS